MKFVWWMVLVALAPMAGVGCRKPAVEPGASASTNGPSAPVPRVTFEGHLNQALPKLHTIKLWLGAQELITEMCTNDVQRMTGMMFRTNLAQNEAMLFVFPFAHQAAFYMKNTTVPLSLAYIDPKGVILEIHDLQPLNLKSVPADSDNVQYVLETVQGWFKRNHIGPGTVVRTEHGTLAETFRRP